MGGADGAVFDLFLDFLETLPGQLDPLELIRQRGLGRVHPALQLA